MSGVDAVLGDLRAMADSFGREAKVIADLGPRVHPSQAATGDAGLDGVVTAVLGLTETLTADLAASVQHHHDALVHAHDSYERRDIDNRFLYDDLNKPE